MPGDPVVMADAQNGQENRALQSALLVGDRALATQVRGGVALDTLLATMAAVPVLLEG